MYSTILNILFQQRQTNSNLWIRCVDGRIPSNAVQGGRDHGDHPLFIGRAEHQGALIPGKVGYRFLTWKFIKLLYSLVGESNI